MDSGWRHDFERRLREFSLAHPHSDGDVPISIKVRVLSGCYHREHSPHAYEIIDSYLSRLAPDEREFRFEEHESGPEIILYVASGVSLATSIINLVATIIKARSESVKRGDRPSEPLELIIRHVAPDGEYFEKVLFRIEATESVDSKTLERLLRAALPLRAASGHEARRRPTSKRGARSERRDKDHRSNS